MGDAAVDGSSGNKVVVPARNRRRPGGSDRLSRAAAQIAPARRPRRPITEELRLYPGLDALPAEAVGLFGASGKRDLALGKQWFHNVVQNGLPRGARAHFALLSANGVTWAMLPLAEQDGCLGSLTNCYTCIFTPLVDAREPALAAGLLGREFGRLCAGWPVARLEALPADWPWLGPFVEGLRMAHLPVRCFANFGNWHEPIGGRSWPTYLAGRPARLREVLRRKSRQAVRAGGIEFETITRPADVARGVAAYEAVYANSWKPPEPYPRFNPALIAAAAAAGMLRLGLAWHRGRPVAAQLWIVAGGRATVMKLAHDRSCDALSPGTLLTARMIEQLIEEGVEAIDFGRGDDDYKRLWASQRRRRIGILIANPLRLRGLLTWARHDAGVALRPLRRRVLAEPRTS